MAPKSTNKSAAVRQQKAAKVQATDTPERAIFRALNFFPTPPWAARAGAEVLKKIDDTARIIWEPACGEGHMAEALKEFFPTVYATDIHSYGYGEVVDFLLVKDRPEALPDVDWVVSNPPFEHAAAFVEQGLRYARTGVAMLLRIAFLEGVDRYPLLHGENSTLGHVAVFSERVSVVLGCYDPDASAPVCMAWFFFWKGAYTCELSAIPPGTKVRLHRVEDVRRFAKMAPAPLFDLSK